MASALMMLLTTLQLCVLSFPVASRAHKTVPKSSALHSDAGKLEMSSRSLQDSGKETVLKPNEHRCVYGNILAMRNIGIELIWRHSPLFDLYMLFGSTSRS